MTRVIIDIDVSDEEALYEAAMAQAKTDGLDEDSAKEMLRPAGIIDVHACLIMVVDPGISPAGTEILESYVED